MQRCNFLPRMIFSRFCSKDLPAPQKTFLVLALLPLLVFDIAFQTLFAPINLSDLSAAAYYFFFLASAFAEESTIFIYSNLKNVGLWSVGNLTCILRHPFT